MNAAMGLVAMLLYIFPPLWMLTRKGWPIRAGLTMLFASLLSLVPILSPAENSPGDGLLLLAAAPFVLLALLTIIAGIIAAAVRSGRRRPASTASGL